ncbi:MAG TPA: reverse transcriptase family protein [Urbifossiella sp.]|jgi:retron-type reverse transcriptase
MRSHHRERAYRNLAAALLSVEWREVELRKAARLATGLRFKRTPPFLRKTLAAFPTRPDFDRLLALLMRRHEHYDFEGGVPPIRQVFVLPSIMVAPPAAAGPVVLPQLPTEAAFADWLGITPGRLRWLADISGRNRLHPEGPLRTYRHRWIAKPGGRARLLEIPKTGLKLIQRKILAEILNQIPTHNAVHGFRPGRSIVTNAAPHCGKRIVVRFDLRDFFPSIPALRIYRIFRTFGYPETVARLLAGLCTTRLPRDVWEAKPNPPGDGSDHAAWQRLASRHLPQGAPTSPALANLVAFRLDGRLAGFAACVDADFTRYADDLAFSGSEELARKVTRFAVRVAAIAAEEGFALNFNKTRVMRRSQRQQIAGVVVNVRPNSPRREYDSLKAILTNCIRHGAESQNREKRADFRAYLSGRVAHLGAINPVRGRKLWALFDRIVWNLPEAQAN